MNFGTPQEMIDEHRDTYPDENSGCFPILLLIVFILVVLCITK
ncbi:hypothetical protein P2559Y_0050 [Croceibacter phage P2559Y]|nr:hypothetical protein P2559Y_0050 [Croceibacter phage P2559Y]AGM14113.1 hypothetical protein P2559Y_0050 [Croceibacter phage P2559Y]